MEQVTLQDYRCFRSEQSARLGRLTLLVGENSTGKTSFLAILRALWNVAFQEIAPNFREPPYDLGRFREIAHHRGARGSAASSFGASFTTTLRSRNGKRNISATFSVTFKRRDIAPFPVVRRLSSTGRWIEHRFPTPGQKQHMHGTIRFGSNGGAWEYVLPDDLPFVPGGSLPTLRFLPSLELLTDRFVPLNGTAGLPPDNEWSQFRRLVWDFHSQHHLAAPYAGAPVRSRPLRTYDPLSLTPDPEGEYIPLYLANLRSTHSADWEPLKAALQTFGRDAGLFHEIDVKLLGDVDGGAFELQVRKFGEKLKGPRRNLADLGYGVSQVLPIVTELLKRDPRPMFLLQQPEVHLHPSAQAALGGLLCNVAARGQRQLIIETHSDHMLNRIRMDVRDGRTELTPNDVSILYFEPRDLNVRIHSLGIDEQGNVLHAPDSYRRFFLKETQRSLGL